MRLPTCPCGKRAFPTRRQAEKAVSMAKRRQTSWATNRREHRVYECDEVDGHFHLTSMNRRDFEAV